MGLASRRVKPGQMESEFADESNNRAMLLPRNAMYPNVQARVLDTIVANKVFQHRYRRAVRLLRCFLRWIRLRLRGANVDKQTCITVFSRNTPIRIRHYFGAGRGRQMHDVSALRGKALVRRQGKRRIVAADELMFEHALHALDQVVGGE
jgi:hypothetical protein